jgi:hypothetical protein
MDEAEYFALAKREMFPKMQDSAFVLSIVGDPDPKLCLEIGAAIMFDKPIIAVVPKGRPIPLSLRTIAHKVVELDDPTSESSRKVLMDAITELTESIRFRG